MIRKEIGFNTLIIGSHDHACDIYKEKLILSNNYIKSDKEVLNRTVFDKFDTNLCIFPSIFRIQIVV